MSRSSSQDYGTSATRLSGLRIVLAVALVGTLVLGGVGYYRFWRAHPAAQADAEASPSSQTVAMSHYEAPEPKPAAAPVKEKDDTLARQLGLLAQAVTKVQEELRKMAAEIEALKKRKPTTTIVKDEREKKSMPAPTLYVTRKLEESPTPVPALPQYTLAPGDTKIPCIVEPLLNSEVEGMFTAKVTTGVYDTRTRRHLLIPQGSTILARSQSELLVYGNERIPTMSLLLTLPDGRTVDLGTSPMTDRLGTMGLTGDVDTHFWRIFGAVFIGGALSGGAQALQVAAAEAGGAQYVASGVGRAGSQAIGRQMGRAMDTRPTIRVFPGDLCHVILVKPVQLTAMWE